MSEAIPMGKLTGVPLRAHWSVLVILWLFTWSLATTLPQTAPGYSAPAYWTAGLAGALVLLASLMAHELTHAVVAQRAGVKVSGVTLWLFGGVTRLGGEARSPRTEFRIAASGPAMSLTLAAVFGALAAALDVSGGPHIVVAVAWWLSGINLLLGLFNLLPGAPLDGGRILLAYLWHRYDDKTRAVVGAARGGRILAYTLIAWGLVEFLAGWVIGGVWTAFIGWFVFSAAREEEMRALTRQALAGVRVADTMTAQPVTVPGSITVEDFVQRYLLGHRHSAYPVEGPGGVTVGLIGLAQVREVRPVDRASTLVQDAAIPMGQVPTAAPDELITTLLERLTPRTGHRVLVMDAGSVVGIVTPRDITRLIDVRRLAAHS